MDGPTRNVVNAQVASDAVAVNVAQFGVLPDGKDATEGVLKALAFCRTQGRTTLTFPTGHYDFYPELAEERYLHICNNDEGLKRIVFPLVDFEDLTIDGQGSEFVFHGPLNPFLISGSSSITLLRFSIDFSRTFHSEGIILSTGQQGMDVHIPEQFPYEVSGGLLRFTGQENGQVEPACGKSDAAYESNHLLEFDTEKRKTADKVKDFYFRGNTSYPAQDLGDRKVRLLVPCLTGSPGNTLVFGPNHRNNPAFTLHRSRDIVFDSVTIHHAGGMGIIAQLCRDVHVKRCRVTPSGGRMVSTTADATHFVNCSGMIRLTDNLFENQLDDAANIHGVYMQVVEIPGPRELIVKWGHYQQHGLDFLEEGLGIEFVQARTLKTLGNGKVLHATSLNKEYAQVVFAEDIPSGLTPGDAIGANQDFPEVEISRNTIRNNRARGILLNCRGKTRVSDNHFHTAGAAILFEGDTSFWFEQGGVRDCVIEANLFDNCLYGVWGKAVIDVQSGIESDMESTRYHRNIEIRKNRFVWGNHCPLLNAFCVDQFHWHGNQIEQPENGIVVVNSENPFNLSHCSNVSIEDDLYTG